MAVTGTLPAAPDEAPLPSDDGPALADELLRTGRLAAVGELAAGTAHELNNPLFAILGLVEFLLAESEPGTKAHDRLLLIQQTGLEIKEIVRALLDFARGVAGEPALVSLDDVAADALDLLRLTTSTKAVDLVGERSAVPTPVHASAGELTQLVVHLVTNAQRVTPDGGSIAVAVRREGDAALLTVSDTGPWIPPELADRVFEPFFTTRRDGTGLGLTVARALAQRHGGELTLASEPGGGARFTLRLPLAEAAP